MPNYPITTTADNGFVQAIPANGFVVATGETILVTLITFGALRFTGLPFRSYSQTTGLLGAPTTTRNERSTLFRTHHLQLTLAGTGPGTLLIDLVDEIDPAAFVIGSFELNSRPLQLAVASVALPTGVYLFTTTIDLLTLTQSLHDSVGWQGKFAFRLRPAGGESISVLSSLSATPPTLVTQETTVETGLVGAKWKDHGVRVDAKTGEWVPRDQAVRDGYSRRQWVSHDNYDPPDWETERRRPLRESRRNTERDDLS